MRRLVVAVVKKRKPFRWKLGNRSYYALAGVCLLVVVACIDRAALRNSSSLGDARPPLVMQKAGITEAASFDPLTAKPWSFFHPSWENDSIWPRLPFIHESASAPTEVPIDMRTLVDDPRNRIERDFKVPPYLRDRVVFWMQVHAIYSSRMRVVHDRSNTAIVYGYIDFRPLFRVLGNSVATEVRARAIEKQILKELKGRLAEAGEVAKTSLLSVPEKNELRSFLSKFGAMSPTATQSLIEEVRTQTGQSDEFLAALHRSKNLLPHIESVFRRHGLPVALCRIPFVESSFNVRARSKVGAVGIWQFMPETARQMIGTSDEKAWADPLKQTAGAVRIIKIFHSLLPDWGTTVTAYNSGVGRLQQLVKKHKLKSVEGLVSLTSTDDTLGFAGKNFFAQFLSANLIEAYKEELFNHQLEPADYLLVFKGQKPFPKESCDL